MVLGLLSPHRSVQRAEATAYRGDMFCSKGLVSGLCSGEAGGEAGGAAWWAGPLMETAPAMAGSSGGKARPLDCEEAAAVDITWVRCGFSAAKSSS